MLMRPKSNRFGRFLSFYIDQVGDARDGFALTCRGGAQQRSGGYEKDIFELALLHIAKDPRAED